MEEKPETQHRAGFVNIIGNPNVGKSTLMNALVGERLSIITSKAQTTRHRIHGIVNGEDFQIVYSDTPGILEPAYKMHEGMMQFVHTALNDADVLLLVVELGEQGFRNEAVLKRIQKSDTPVVLVINKIDLGNQEILEEKVDFWHGQFPEATILPVSALGKVNTEQVIKAILRMLPPSPPYFSKEELTDRPLRFFVSEIIREKIFLNYQKEVPYSCEVVIEAYEEGEKLDRIRAEIHVARNSQKGILIGHKGSMLKKTGTEARKEIEAFVGKKVFLDLHVKVSKDWRENERQLKRFGYFH